MKVRDVFSKAWQWWKLNSSTWNWSNIWASFGVGVNILLGLFAYFALLYSRESTKAALEQTQIAQRLAESSLEELRVNNSPTILAHWKPVDRPDGIRKAYLTLTNLSSKPVVPVSLSVGPIEIGGTIDLINRDIYKGKSFYDVIMPGESLNILPSNYEEIQSTVKKYYHPVHADYFNKVTKDKFNVVVTFLISNNGKDTYGLVINLERPTHLESGLTINGWEASPGEGLLPNTFTSWSGAVEFPSPAKP